MYDCFSQTTVRESTATLFQSALGAIEEEQSFRTANVSHLEHRLDAHTILIDLNEQTIADQLASALATNKQQQETNAARVSLLERAIGELATSMGNMTQTQRIDALAAQGGAFQASSQDTNDDNTAMLAIYIGAANAFFLLTLIVFLLVRSRGGESNERAYDNANIEDGPRYSKEGIHVVPGTHEFPLTKQNPLHGHQESVNEDGNAATTDDGQPSGMRNLLKHFNDFEADANGNGNESQVSRASGVMRLNHASDIDVDGQDDQAANTESFEGFDDGSTDAVPVGQFRFSPGRTKDPKGKSAVSKMISGFEDDDFDDTGANQNQPETFDEPSHMLSKTGSAATDAGDGEFTMMNVAGSATFNNGNFTDSSFYNDAGTGEGFPDDEFDEATMMTGAGGFKFDVKAAVASASEDELIDSHNVPLQRLPTRKKSGGKGSRKGPTRTIAGTTVSSWDTILAGKSLHIAGKL